jgi:hypothetical protein
MKKFNVSIALKVYSNFETHVQAKSEKEAINLAIEKYDNGNYTEDNITAPDWSNTELDLGKNNYNAHVERVLEK